MPLDVDKIAEAVLDAVEVPLRAMRKDMAALSEQVKACDGRIAAFPVPVNGKDADEESIASKVAALMAGALAEKTAEIDDMKRQLAALSDVLTKQEGGFSKRLEDFASQINDVVAQVDAFPVPVNGKDADPSEVAAIVLEDLISKLDEPFTRITAFEKDMADLRKDIGALPNIIFDDVAKTVGNMGKAQASLCEKHDTEIETLWGRVNSLQSDCRNALEQFKELPDQMKAIISEQIAALPAPKDGRSISVEDVAPLIEAQIKAAVSALPPSEKGDPGVGLAGCMIDRDGQLIVTLSNGAMQKLGQVNGIDGKNGRDGFGFENLTAEFDGQRTLSLKFSLGQESKSFDVKMPIILDRGVYTKDCLYEPGDAVTFGGSLWIAQQETKATPGNSDEWRLAVKRGRDGVNGKMVDLPKKVKL